MNTNNTKRNYCGTVRLIFCILFIITGVWFPSAFMWVVWAFVGYVALMVIVAVIALIMAAVMVHKASKWF